MVAWLFLALTLIVAVFLIFDPPWREKPQPPPSGPVRLEPWKSISPTPIPPSTTNSAATSLLHLPPQRVIERRLANVRGVPTGQVASL